MIEYKKIEKEHKESIIDLLSLCFPKVNFLETYEYEHHQNPTSNYHPVGVIAMKNDIVIGYRGFVALPYIVNNKKIKMVVPAGTATHPNYQKQGIFTRLIEESFEQMKQQGYSFFFNTSTNRNSINGNLKKGWLVLGDKDYYIKKIITKGIQKVNENYLFDGDDDIVNVIKDVTLNSTIYNSYRIKINLEDTNFISWIFNRPDFYFSYIKDKENNMLGYISYKISSNMCIINHFDVVNDKFFSSLLNNLLRKHKISTFYVYGVKNKDYRTSLLKKNLFFKTNYKIIRKKIGKKITPFLIRPTQKEFNKQDLEIDLVKVNKINNWDITALSNF